ncbi:MAG: 16S rRNA (guanine(527)-N(7))-methyltransferase RsmG [Betaproteobacteria bacterium]|nr:16S rRNA (guanine(527)-N(7))-methyltransferase RsmG [Betaproteobacteria bacterium]
MNIADALAQGVSELGLDLSADIRQRLIEYVALLQKWNRVYNLTAVREAQEMVSHHLLDSLAVLPHVRARSILDVGSGAGLPGIPLALALPQTRVTLLDANQKKAAFLQQAVIELVIENAAVVCERVEIWQPPERFEVVISRAFSDLGEFLALAGRLCAKEGVLAAMKGSYPKDELARLPRAFKLKSVVALKVPGLVASRHLVLVEPA